MQTQKGLSFPALVGFGCLITGFGAGAKVSAWLAAYIAPYFYFGWTRLCRQQICAILCKRQKKDIGKMANAYERHDISDESWAKIEFLLPGRKGTWGGNARDNRQFINAVFWILRTGAPWRDLPPSYGDWKNTHRRFCRWRDKGVWEKLLQELIDNPEFELLMIDASHIKVHAHGSGARGGNQDMAKTKGGSTPRYIWPWMRMVCRSESLLQKVPRRIVSRLKP